MGRNRNTQGLSRFKFAGTRGENRMDKKKYWREETIRFVISPTYYVYIIAIVLTVLLKILPGFLEAFDSAQPGVFATEAARFFASEIGMILMYVPAFAVSAACIRDKEQRKRYGKVLREELPGRDAAVIRMVTMIIWLYLPLPIAAVGSDAVIASKCGSAFFGMSLMLSVIWLLPTLIFMTGFAGALTEWTGNCLPGIIGSIVVWVFTQGSTADFNDYFSCVAIRHASSAEVVAFEAVDINTAALTINRIVVAALGFLFIFIAVKGCEFRKNGKKA